MLLDHTIIIKAIFMKNSIDFNQKWYSFIFKEFIYKVNLEAVTCSKDNE